MPERTGLVRLTGLLDFDCDSIANDAPNQWRWLSLPQSRLVLNPAASDDFSPLPLRSDLPLHAAYYAGLKPHRLVGLVTVGIKSNEGGPVQHYRHTWYPYKLSFEATNEDAGIKLSGCDFLADENTIVRVLKVLSDKSPSILRFEGMLHGRLRPDSGVLLVEHADFFHALMAGKVEGPELTPARLDARPQVRGDEWFLETVFGEGRHSSNSRSPNTNEASGYFVSIGFATRAEGAEAAVRRAAGVLSGPSLAKRLQERKACWSEYLRRVPAPEQFGIVAVDSKGVSPEIHRRFYYGAWTFVISNVLPAMPENGYPYPQTPCGKPSLWNFGASKAPASAAWESFFGQQMLAYVMPDIACAAFEGIIAQVDETGWLDGECLPSRKAQTAWILYSLTGELTRLRAVYPAIRRYLLWREQNPRWIYLDHDNPDEKDSSFVDQLLVDIDFAVRIAREIGEDADIGMWQQRRQVILKNYRKWFFFTDGRPPAEYFFSESKRHEPGNLNWVLTGLHIRDLPFDLADELKRLYLQRHSPDRDFCGMGWTKYGTESFIAYGLIEHGMYKQAREFINASLRDQIRAGEFSENYAAGREGGLPGAWGVKPSLFGAVQMIDFTCLNSGVRLDQGRPAGVCWPPNPVADPAHVGRKED
ncbi:MAG: hypothetical protein ACUVXJ_14370 [Phycisphaerae bacterium]